MLNETISDVFQLADFPSCKQHCSYLSAENGSQVCVPSEIILWAIMLERQNNVHMLNQRYQGSQCSLFWLSIYYIFLCYSSSASDSNNSKIYLYSETCYRIYPKKRGTEHTEHWEVLWESLKTEKH